MRNKTVFLSWFFSLLTGWELFILNWPTTVRLSLKQVPDWQSLRDGARHTSECCWPCGGAGVLPAGHSCWHLCKYPQLIPPFCAPVIELVTCALISFFPGLLYSFQGQYQWILPCREEDDFCYGNSHVPRSFILDWSLMTVKWYVCACRLEPHYLSATLAVSISSD